MPYKAHVGLTMRLEIETGRFYLGRDYSEAVEAAGGLPVHLPLIPERTFVRSVLETLDGVLLPGCDSDIDPRYYGEDPHPDLKRVVPEKDAFDLLVLEEAERSGVPVLAICYGMQALNVSRGGSLIQDIESQVEGAIKHEQGIPLGRNSHAIRITEGSRLSRLSQGSFGPEDVYVNSHHHQAIRKVGKNLNEAARANDGVVECIEDSREERHVLGVQWHPELSWRTDSLSRAIFEDFVGKCTRAARRDAFVVP